eukprot:comp4583_c0_seq1/m.3286 comp4583_c0_seq1/g.3286  ORF comp4583_c0_seq1/g.3286 comp4583_c0_seq1/m.3286 type:complete len:314 (-) comp4583_c0_seq1:416-1357(-)
MQHFPRGTHHDLRCAQIHHGLHGRIGIQGIEIRRRRRELESNRCRVARRKHESAELGDSGDGRHSDSDGCECYPQRSTRRRRRRRQKWSHRDIERRIWAACDQIPTRVKHMHAQCRLQHCAAPAGCWRLLHDAERCSDPGPAHNVDRNDTHSAVLGIDGRGDARHCIQPQRNGRRKRPRGLDDLARDFDSGTCRRGRHVDCNHICRRIERHCVLQPRRVEWLVGHRGNIIIIISCSRGKKQNALRQRVVVESAVGTRMHFEKNGERCSSAWRADAHGNSCFRRRVADLQHPCSRCRPRRAGGGVVDGDDCVLQ